MRKVILAVLAAIIVGTIVILATSGSSKHRAEKYLASAQEFVAKGDDQRAVVELRNALKSDPTLRSARVLMAQLMLKGGHGGDAFAQYRELYSHDANDMDSARQMAIIAFDAMSWDDARQYSDIVLNRMPDDVVVQAIRAGLDYHDAAVGSNAEAMQQAAVTAGAILDKHPEVLQARQILVADRMRADDTGAAMKLVDDGLAITPDNRGLQNIRLVLLEKAGRKDELAAALLKMSAQYPEDEDLRRALVQFYVSSGNLDAAEKVLRDHVDANGTDPKPRLLLLRFLGEIRSPAAMRDELAAILSQNPLPKDVAADEVEFRTIKAKVDFSLGDKPAAMSALEALIRDGKPSIELDRVKVELARMRLDTGDQAGAHKLIDEVLAHDPHQVDAMKMKSDWLIESDQTDQAVAMLRDALADAPQDPQILTLMARAYQRQGQPDLMSDMLARAVEVSHQAPAESLNYARWLMQQQKYTSAESVLIEALRRQPDGFDLLVQLAQTHLAMQDWPRLQQDIAAIGDRFKTDAARRASDELTARMLGAQGHQDELNSFLDQLAGQTANPLAVRMAIVRNAVAAGDMAKAGTEAQSLLADNPDSPDVKLLVAQIALARGDADGALSATSALMAAKPDYLPAFLATQAIQMRQGKVDDALATIDKGLARAPQNAELQLAKAYAEEKGGNIDGAIAIYEAMYAANSANAAVANNLASLLASTRGDQASLDRAWTIARRLNGTDVPAFQDTYGWIAFRRGDAATALPLLENAAKGLPGDPAVAYHLGQVYAALKRPDDAKAQYARAESLLSGGAVGYPALAQDLVRAQAEAK